MLRVKDEGEYVLKIRIRWEPLLGGDGQGEKGDELGNVPCQILLHGIRHMQHGRLHLRFSLDPSQFCIVRRGECCSPITAALLFSACYFPYAMYGSLLGDTRVSA